MNRRKLVIAGSCLLLGITVLIACRDTRQPEEAAQSASNAPADVGHEPECDPNESPNLLSSRSGETEVAPAKLPDGPVLYREAEVYFLSPPQPAGQGVGQAAAEAAGQATIRLHVGETIRPLSDGRREISARFICRTAPGAMSVARSSQVDVIRSLSVHSGRAELVARRFVVRADGAGDSRFDFNDIRKPTSLALTELQAYQSRLLPGFKLFRMADGSYELRGRREVDSGQVLQIRLVMDYAADAAR